MTEICLERVKILGSSALGGNERQGSVSVECLRVVEGCPENVFVQYALDCKEVEKRVVLINGVKRNIWFNVRGLAERGLGQHEIVIFESVEQRFFPVIGVVLIELCVNEKDEEEPIFLKGLKSGDIRLGMITCAIEDGVVKLVYQ